MKIDVECHEPETLAGFGPRIQSDRSTMLIEVVEEKAVDKLGAIFSGLD